MRDGKWPDLARVDGDQRRERNRSSGHGRLDVNLVERGDVAFERRRHLQNHVVGVDLREILGHLSLPERIVQGIVDNLRLDAEASPPDRG